MIPHNRARLWDKICPAAALLILLLIVAGTTHAQDFQSWNEVDLTASWHKVDFLVPFVARTDSSLPNPQLAATGITVDLHLPAHLTLTPGYLFVTLPQPNYLVHVPLVALTGTLHPGRLTVADRNRLEKLIGYPGSPVRYRNRLLVDLPFGPQSRLHAFLDDEIFFNLSAGNFNQNRLQAGAGAHLTPRLLLDLYYLQKNPASGATTHVLGTTLRVNLTPHTPAALRIHNP
jgi:hypothetical protein